VTLVSPPLVIRRVGLRLALVYGVCLAIIALSAAIGRLIDRPIRYFTHDPIQVIEVVRPCSGSECMAAGLMSNVGVIVWITGAAVLLFTGALLSAAGAPALRSPYLWFGAFTGWLAVDDMFVVHEFAREWGAAVSLGELRLLAVYALAFSGLIAVFRRFLARTSWWLIPVAGLWYLISIFTDTVFHTWDLVEDGSKLFGVATWVFYLVGTAFQELRLRFVVAGGSR
jgi:hypothetical protein